MLAVYTYQGCQEAIRYDRDDPEGPQTELKFEQISLIGALRRLIAHSLMTSFGRKRKSNTVRLSK